MKHGKQALPRVRTVSFGFHVQRGPQQVMAAADQHNEIELNLIECGEMVFRRGAETLTLSPGQAVLYWAAVPHQVLAVKPGTEISWLVLPLSWFLGWTLSPEFKRRVLDGGFLQLPATAMPGGGRSLGGWAADFATGSEELRQIVRLEVEAFFRRLSLTGMPERAVRAGEIKAVPVPPAEAAHQCHHVERMVRQINEHFREAITVEEIARAVRLNPEYAMRLFRKHWGMTVGTFLLRLRISEARRLLLLGDAPLAEIAFGCGFQSLSRFYEAFKTECGCSPGAYRRRRGASAEQPGGGEP